jgi:hypothetical protein
MLVTSTANLGREYGIVELYINGTHRALSLALMPVINRLFNFRVHAHIRNSLKVLPSPRTIVLEPDADTLNVPVRSQTLLKKTMSGRT